jgi:hypothetical protein
MRKILHKKVKVTETANRRRKQYNALRRKTVRERFQSKRVLAASLQCGSSFGAEEKRLFNASVF